jgi:Uma2 family endonuclease
MKVQDYLSGDEHNRKRELVWGVVRDPPAPRFGHQSLVLQIGMLLKLHVREHDLGAVCVSPADVVLDEHKNLIVQPDVFFIRKQRMAIIRDQVWGAPDLVVEISSPGTAEYDSVTKVEWYRMYGVREGWIVDPRSRGVTVIDLEATEVEASRRFSGDDSLRSTVLPAFGVAARELFEV